MRKRLRKNLLHKKEVTLTTPEFISTHKIEIRPTEQGVDLLVDGFFFGGGHLNTARANRFLKTGIDDGSIPQGLANLKRWDQEIMEAS